MPDIEALKQEYIQRFETMKGITGKKMFGGAGIWKDGVMFVLISSKGVVHFRANEETKGRHEALGISAFMSSEKKKGMPYYQVPDEVLASDSEIMEWAEEAYAAALAAKKK